MRAGVDWEEITHSKRATILGAGPPRNRCSRPGPKLSTVMHDQAVKDFAAVKRAACEGTPAALDREA